MMETGKTSARYQTRGEGGVSSVLFKSTRVVPPFTSCGIDMGVTMKEKIKIKKGPDRELNPGPHTFKLPRKSGKNPKRVSYY